VAYHAAGHIVDILVLKLTLTPALIGVSAIIGRRWGPGVGGWIVGIPFTSGPIALLLGLGHGWLFAGTAATGILAGTGSEAVFCLAYAWVASRRGWGLSLAAGIVAFAVSTACLLRLSPSVAAALAIAVLPAALALPLLPRRAGWVARPPGGGLAAAGDIATRMAVGAALVLALTAAATLLGPTLTGLLSPFPLFGAVMMVFSQRLHGGGAGIAAARGLLWGLFGAALFFLVLAALLPRIGWISFLLAIPADLIAQGVTLPLVRRGTVAGVPPAPQRAAT